MKDSTSQFSIRTKHLSLFYDDARALKNINLSFHEKQVSALIGPSGCGKSTFLRCINRMNDLIQSVRIEGSVLLDDFDIYQAGVDPVKVRQHVGMVFQKPNPFPKSIYDNLAWGMKINGITGDYDELVEHNLKKAGLWEEVKNKLKSSALSLSGGQQQRLCIARAIAINPQIILMDEPTSALDPISTTIIENLIEELKQNYTIIIVTHNMQQAGRIADFTSFFLLGEVIEHGPTSQLFYNPENKKTEAYITGRFG